MKGEPKSLKTKLKDFIAQSAILNIPLNEMDLQSFVDLYYEDPTDFFDDLN